MSATGAQALSIATQTTIVDGETTPATGTRTLNLTIAAAVQPGALIVAKLKTTAAETTVFGTGMTGATITGAAGLTKVVLFVYDGTNFVEVVNVPSAVTVALTATGAQALSIATQTTIVNGVTTAATGNRTLNLTIAAAVQPGARMFVKSKTAGTETTIFGTAMQGATITGEAGKTYTVEFVYDGTNFVEAGTPVKID